MNVTGLLAFVLCLGLNWVGISLFLRFGGDRLFARRTVHWHHTHTGTVPRVGGVSLVVAFVGLGLWGFGLQPDAPLSSLSRAIIPLSALAMFGLGFWDDLRPLGATRKLFLQIIIAGAVAVSGVGIEFWRTPSSPVPVPLGVWGPVLTVLWLVSLTNLINLIDGIDGLAAGISVMLFGLLGYAAYHTGNDALLIFGMAGAVLGFLRHNFPPAKVYLGDGGAYFLGFQVGLIALMNSQRGTYAAALLAPLFVLALPITDAALTIARRGLRGLPLFRPDRKHLHHRLMASGGSSLEVLLRMCGVNTLFLTMGIAVIWSAGRWFPQLMLLAIVTLLVCAGTCGFSRSWFAVHRTVHGCVRMRGEVAYARCVSQLIELEAARCGGPDELWPHLTSAANRLGFAGLTITLNRKPRTWRRKSLRPGQVRRFEWGNGPYGSIELKAPACLSPESQFRCGHRSGCTHSRAGSCLADPRVFDTISELLAEAWNNAANQWHRRHIPVRFGSKQAAETGTAPNEWAGLELADPEELKYLAAAK